MGIYNRLDTRTTDQINLKKKQKNKKKSNKLK